MLSLILLLACSDKDTGENPGDDTSTTDQDSGVDDTGPTGDDTAEPPDGPHVVGLRVEPDEPYTDDDLECRWDEIVDASSVTIVWFANKTRLDATGTTLSSDYTSRGQWVSCEATPEADGAYTDFANVFIKNTAPIVSEVTLSPEDATEDDSVLIADIEYTDIDEDPARFYEEHFTWFVNDEEVAYDEPALGRAYWDKGDEVKVRAYVRDYANSNTEWSLLTIIGNAPPTAPGVRFTGADGDPLTCQVSEPSVDADEDAITYTQEWRRFGLPVSLTLDCEPDGSACTLATPEAGASYTCEVTPDDGEDEGESGLAVAEVGGDVIRYLWLGDEAAAQAASKLLVSEDIDGDGKRDIIVGAPRASLGSTNGGAVMELLSGAFGEESLVGGDAVGRIVYAEGTEVRLGNALGWLPDIDGDGVAELITGAPNYDQDTSDDSGAALVFFSDSWGSDDERSDDDYDLAYFGFENDEEVGQSVAAADLNGDGLPELMVGAPGRYDLKDVAGGVIFFPGSKLAAGGELNAFTSEGSGALMGEGNGEGSGLLAVDIDGDGVKDLLVQAQDAGTISAILSEDLQGLFSDDPKGFAELVSMSERVTYTLSGGTGDHAGDSMVEVDLADGSAGVLVGAPDAGDGGAAYLWSVSDGSVTLSDLTSRFEGASDEQLGASVAVLGDSGGPAGDTWLAFGAPDDDTSFNGAGAVYVLGLSDWTGGVTTADVNPDWSAVYGESANAAFGAAVAGPGDWDGDGQPDLAVGLPKVDDDSVGFDVGGVAIWTDYLP